MSERGTLILGAMVGAVVGVGVGFFVFTERGRRLRAEVQPELEALVREARSLGASIEDLRRRGSTRTPAQPWPRRAI